MRTLTLRTILILVVTVVCFAEASSQVRLRPEEADKLLVEKTEPEYPGIARMLKLQDTVTIDATIAETGSVVSAKLLSGNVAFKSAAIGAVMKRRYNPHLVDGIPTGFVTTVTLEFSLGISKEDYERDRKIAEKFFPLESNCRGLVIAQNWKDAEPVCRNAVSQAEMFQTGRELEKMGAYELTGHVMRGQKRYVEALDYYKRARVAAGPRLDEDDAELGRLYAEMAITHYHLRQLTEARELFVRAERVLQAAYDKFKSDESDRELENLRRGYIRSLRQTLEHHLIAAEKSGATSEVEAIKKLMKNLP